MINFASFFTGIGGFDLGFEDAGMSCVFQCELDANCRELLGRKFTALILPDILAIAAAHRRIRKGKQGINHEKWNRLFELLRSAAVWCGGFPCQDVSVAGLRAGLAGSRSGLWFAFRRVLALFQPAWVVIENVPGLLSSNAGSDLASIVSGLEKLGYRWAYRTLDAQYFNVAQRRERVFIVASRGNFRCAEVLFERESVCWSDPPSREAAKGVARPIAACAPGSSGYRNDADTADNLIPDTVGTLNDGAHRGGGSTDKMRILDEYLPSVAWALQERDAKGQDSSTKEGHLIVTRQGGFFDEAIGVNARQDPDSWIERTGPLDTDGSTQAITVPICFTAKDHGADASTISPTLRAGGHSSSHANGGVMPAISGRDGVRRLTPLECERLQGFPDKWTDGFADSVRYRMTGNAVCRNVAAWIGRRLVRFFT